MCLTDTYYSDSITHTAFPLFAQYPNAVCLAAHPVYAVRQRYPGPLHLPVPRFAAKLEDTLGHLRQPGHLHGVGAQAAARGVDGHLPVEVEEPALHVLSRHAVVAEAEALEPHQLHV